ncbi:MAG: hypothetical protein RL367_2546, partial [Pseudomonadota bacterium]
MLLRLIAGVALCFATVPGTALAKTKADATFTFPKDKPVKIVLFRPDVEVGSLGASGVPTPNPDWTANSRKYTLEALVQNRTAKSMAINPMGELTGADGEFVAEYQSLFQAVGASMLVHNYAQKLPTKKLPGGKYKFDWTLGPGAQHLRELSGGADYGLFIYGYDAYATAGRKTMQIFVLLATAAMGAAQLPQGGLHISYASLVDFQTGNIVWFNLYGNK